MIKQETIPYSIGQDKFIGRLFYQDGKASRRPAVLVAHAWRGQDQFAQDKAKQLAELGYIGFAADLYGEGKEVKTDEESAALMIPLFKDRRLLQTRVKAAYETIRVHPLVDTSKIGAIGFCFGGLAAIELFRSGADVKGVVSFHGVLGNKKEGLQAQTVPISPSIKGSLLVLHGYRDPLVSLQDIVDFQKEMSDAQADWQMITYGQASHAFTNPDAHDVEKGLVFHAKTNERSWIAMRDFFQEVFK